jgi:hypothetical protein
MSFVNQLPVVDYVSQIHDALSRSNSAWIDISQLLARAADEYGEDSKSFKEIIKSIKFSRSTISKLLAIAKSERLKQYKEKLSSVTSWATLYAIASLDEQQFKSLREKYKFDHISAVPPVITVADVSRVKHSVGKNADGKMRLYATIKINDAAVKARLVNEEMLEKVNKLLRELSLESSFIQVEISSMLDEEEKRFHTKLDERMKTIHLDLAKRAIAAVLSRHIKSPYEKQTDFEKRVLGDTSEDLKNAVVHFPEDTLGRLEFEYDPVAVYTQAYDEIEASEERFHERAKAFAAKQFRAAASGSAEKNALLKVEAMRDARESDEEEEFLFATAA